MEEAKRGISISDLPDDLLIEILLRVPYKIVFQCTSVSKRWFALISNPDFACSFCRHYETNRKCRSRKFNYNFFSKQVLLISRYREMGFSSTPIPSFLQTSQEEEEEACVVGSSEGLLLFCTTSTRDNKKIYYVCNPLTKHWAMLPPNPSSQEQQEVSAGFISYVNPSWCVYKVVLLTEFLGSKSQIKVETFSSMTGQWKKSVLSCPHNIEINLCGSAIAYKQKLHWFMPFDNKFLVYDLNHKVHPIIDGPEEVCPLLGSQCFDVSSGGVRIARLQKLQTPQYSLSIWRLCNNTCKWCLERQINLIGLPWTGRYKVTIRRMLRKKAYVIAFHPNKDIVYLELADHVVSCNFEKKTLALVYDSSYELPPQAFIHVLPTWPTLIPALPALPHNALPRSKRKANGAEVEDGEVRVAEVEADMATRITKRAKEMSACNEGIKGNGVKTQINRHEVM